MFRFIRIYKNIKELDKLVFPANPVPVKLVWKTPGQMPASYLREGKTREEIEREYYAVAIFSQSHRNPLAVACHEVRHRIQKNSSIQLFTKERLVELRKKNKKLQQLIDYLEAVEADNGPLPLKEQDAIIMERITEQLCKEASDPVAKAAKWIKEDSDFFLLSFF